MKEIYEFIKNCSCYFIATMDGGRHEYVHSAQSLISRTNFT